MISRKTFIGCAVLISLLLSFSGINSSPSVSATGAAGKILYVQPGVTGDCSSWEAACDLQTALSVVEAGDEVWVAGGTYFPGPAGDRSATFLLADGVAVYGGFAGNEGTREERDWSAHITTLSGDIDRDGNNEFDTGNAFHVVTSMLAGAMTVMDGFTIRDGNASGGAPHDSGGGMYNSGGNPTLANLTFSLNHADYGGGIFNEESNPTLANITFSGNTASRSGGGMYNMESNPTLTGVVISGNSVLYGSGGGMANTRSNPSLKQVAFTHNIADSGGGLYNIESYIKLDEAIFSENTSISGGGIFNHRSSNTITNVTFSGNGAIVYGGGMYNYFSASNLANVTFTGNGGGAITSHWWSNTTITNSIFWENSQGEIVSDENSNLAIHFSIFPANSIFPDGYEGEGNISQDPLLGQLADNAGFTQTHALLPGSPAIDAGDSSSCHETDQRGLARPVDGDRDGQAKCDIGAFELQLARYLPVIERADQASD